MTFIYLVAYQIDKLALDSSIVNPFFSFKVNLNAPNADQMAKLNNTVV